MMVGCLVGRMVALRDEWSVGLLVVLKVGCLVVQMVVV
jgi:hypothetical protein